MPDRRVTFIPIDFRDTLCEFEKLLLNPGYAQWVATKVLRGVDVDELTKKELAWLDFLEKATGDTRMPARFFFLYLKNRTRRLDSDTKELISFFIRLMQKRPEYANQIFELLK